MSGNGSFSWIDRKKFCVSITPIVKNEPNLPSLCLGTWVFGGRHWGGANEAHCLEAVHCALDHGLNFIDTSPVYGYGVSESIVGKAIAGRRDRFILATKCGLILKDRQVIHQLTVDSIRRECEESLRRLGTDCIDLYQCHWPDPRTPIEETMEGMLALKSEGKIRLIGLSNHPKELFGRALKVCPEIVTSQNQYSLLDRGIEEELLSFLKEKSVGVLAYGPLSGGILTGKYKEEPRFADKDARGFLYKHYSGESFQRALDVLKKLRTLNRPLNQIAINWVRQQPGVTSVLVGCRNADQVKANVKALQWMLTEDELAFIRGIL